MPEDKIKEAFSTIKNTGVFIDESDFSEQLKANPKEVFDIFNSTDDTKGIFIDYDDFSEVLGLGKPEPVLSGADGSGMSSPLQSGELGAMEMMPQEIDEDAQMFQQLQMEQQAREQKDLTRRQKAATVVEKQLERINEGIEYKNLSEIPFTPEERKFVENTATGSFDEGFYNKNWKEVFKKSTGLNPLDAGIDKEGAKPFLAAYYGVSKSKEALENYIENFKQTRAEQFGQSAEQVNPRFLEQGIVQDKEYLKLKRNYDRAKSNLDQQIEPVKKRISTVKTFVNLQKDIDVGAGVKMKAGDVQKAIDKKLNQTVGGQGAQQLYEAKQLGDEKSIKEAEKTYFADIDKDIANIETARQSVIRDFGKIDPVTEANFNEQAATLNAQKQNFFKKPEEVEAQLSLVKPEYSSFQTAMNTLTPQERLKMYMYSRLDSFRKLAYKNGLSEGQVEELLSTGSGTLSTWFERATGQISGKDMQEMKDIMKEVKSIYPAAMLNVQPVSKQRTNVIDRASNSFKTQFGSSAMNQDEKAQNIVEALGITETRKDITPESEEAIDVQMQPISDVERGADLIGMTGAIVPQFMVGSGVLNGVLRVGSAMGKAPAISKSAQWLRGSTLPAKMANRGLSFETTSQIFPETEEGFVVGAAGALAEPLLQGVGKFGGRMINTLFGKNSQKAIDAIGKWNLSKKLGQGVTEAVEETLENITGLWQESDNAAEFRAMLERNYGTLNEGLWNIISPFVLGWGMGMGSDLGKSLSNVYTTRRSELTPQEQAVGDKIVADLTREQNEAAQEMLLGIIADVPTNDLQESKVESENTFDALQQKYDAYVSSGATGMVDIEIDGQTETIHSLDEFNAIMDAHRDMLAAIEVELNNRNQQTQTTGEAKGKESSVSKADIQKRIDEIESMLSQDANSMRENGMGMLIPEAKAELQQELNELKNQQKQTTDETDEAQQGQEAVEQSVLEEPRDDRSQDEAGQESPELRTQVQAEEEVVKVPDVAKGTQLEPILVGGRGAYIDPVTGNEVIGDVYMDGQTVVVESDNKIYEIGNVETLSGQESLPIRIVEPTVVFNDNNEMVYQGSDSSIPRGIKIKPHKEGLKAVKRDKDGNIKRVVVTGEDGKTYNLKGQEAQDLAYLMIIDLVNKGQYTSKIENNEAAKSEIDNEFDRQTKKTTERKADADSKKDSERRDGARITKEQTPPAKEQAETVESKAKESAKEQKAEGKEQEKPADEGKINLANYFRDRASQISKPDPNKPKQASFGIPNNILAKAYQKLADLIEGGASIAEAIGQVVKFVNDAMDKINPKWDAKGFETFLKNETREQRLKESRAKAKATREANKAKIQKLAADIVDAVGKITPKREFYKSYQSMADFKKDYLAKNPDATEKKAESEYKKQRHSDYMASVQQATEPITKSLREKVEAAKKKEQLEAAKDAMIELLSGITEALPKIGIKKVKVNDVNKLIDAIGLSNTQKSFNTQVAKAFDVIDKIVADAESEARSNAIREIRTLLDPENALYKKQAGEKIAKAKYDRRAMAEVKALLEPITDDVLQSMSLKDLDNLFNAIYDTLAEGKDRIRAVVEATKKANIEINRKLMEQVSDKQGRSKEVTGGNQILEEVKKGNVVKVGNAYFKGKEAAEAIAEMINDGTIRPDTIAKVIPVTPTVSKSKSGILRGIRAMAGSYLGFIYDFATNQSSLDSLEKSLYMPVVKAERNVDNETYQAAKRKKDARERIFGKTQGVAGRIERTILGRNWKVRRVLYKKLPFKVRDVNGNEFELTADEAIYLYNVTQRAEMNIKAVGQEGLGKTVTEESLDQIYDYILSNSKLKEYAAWQVEDYFSYFDSTNDILERNGYGAVSRQKMLTEEQYAAKTNPEAAKRYFDRMRKVFGNNMPEFEPYTPASVEGSEMGNLQDRDLLDSNSKNALSVISNNVRSVTSGGALKVVSSEIMMADWQKGTINMRNKLDLLRTLSTAFNKDFRNLLSSVYGASYASEFKETIEDIIIGSASQPVKKASKAMAIWLTAAAPVVMFFNVRSYLFQYLSMPNYAIAEGLFKEYVSMLTNITKSKKYTKEVSELDWVRQRVEGDLSSIEISQLREGKTRYENVVGNVLSRGYFLTRSADVSAIINGGAPLYAVVKESKMKEYIAKGMDKDAAEAKAKDDASLVLYRRTQESQQSSKTYEMSREQKNPFTRLALVFNQVTLQYNRKAIRAARDIKYGRGDLAENIAILMYFGMLNTPIFIGLSKYIKNILDDDDDDEKKIRQEQAKYINDVADGIMKGFGAYGTAATILKNTTYDIALQLSKNKLNKELDSFYRELFEILTIEGTELKDVRDKTADVVFFETFVEGFNVPLSVKGRQFEKFYKRVIDKSDASKLETGAAGIEFATNIPTERMYQIYDQFADALSSDYYTIGEKLLRMANLIPKYQAQLNVYERGTYETTKALEPVSKAKKAVQEKRDRMILDLNARSGKQIDEYIDKVLDSDRYSEEGKLALDAYEELDSYYTKQALPSRIEDILKSKMPNDTGARKAFKDNTSKHKEVKKELDSTEDYYESKAFMQIAGSIEKAMPDDKKEKTALVIYLKDKGFNNRDIDNVGRVIGKPSLYDIYIDYSSLSSSDQLKLKISLSNELHKK
jgi:hypothetical protein